MKDKILEAKKQNPTFGYKRIALLVGCSPNAVKYHLKEGEKKKALIRHYRYKSLNPLCAKLDHFKQIREKKKAFDKIIGVHRKNKVPSKFTTKELLLKFGTTPTCYLTGESIDLDKPETYEFDHIVPVSKGGDNSIENLGLTTREANRAKNNMTTVEFFKLCKKIVDNNS